MKKIKLFLIHLASLSTLLLVTSCNETNNDVSLNDTNGDDTGNTGSCDEAKSAFFIILEPSSCTVDISSKLGVASNYEESVSGTVRNITINGVASHAVGTFPNSGNPNTISEHAADFTMTTTPTLATRTTTAQRYVSGVLFSGVSIDPFAGEFFQTTDGSTNRDWNILALQSTRSLGLDCNNAHVQPTGKYHYHGIPTAFGQAIGADKGTKMVKVGYAADGFPIYYKYAYDEDGTTLKAFDSGWALKTVDRGGDGQSAPSGCPDGTYYQDYEFVGGTGLDECNGRTGKTPESESEYYYLITESFPSVPLCFSGTPDSSFSFGAP